MVALLPSPVLQFCDANGKPYVGGTLAFYIPGTSTKSDTWLESTGTTLNTNPVVLDDAGRCIVFGSGIYRCVLKDAAGNLVWDQLTNSLVSAAMAPVVIAPTIAEAQRLLGIVDWTAAIAAAVAATTAETARALAAEAALQLNIDGVSNNLFQNVQTIEAQIAAEIARAEAAEAALAALIGTVPTSVMQVRTGSGTSSDPQSDVSITFSPPFPNGCASIACYGAAPMSLGYAPLSYYLVQQDKIDVTDATHATGKLWWTRTGMESGEGGALGPIPQPNQPYTYVATGW